MPKTCPSCSTQNVDGAKFCRKCGTVLPSPLPVTAPPPQTQYTASINPAYTPPEYSSPLQQTYFEMQAPQQTRALAGFGARFGAFFIDNLIAGLVFMPGYCLFLLKQG